MLTNEMKPIKFWCQKVLPLVYDDSLSYYEVLAKTVDYLNNVIEDDKNVIKLVNNLEVWVNENKEYIDNYFENLNVQNEINVKLDEMVEDGTFGEIIDPILEQFEQDAMGNLSQQVGDWLEKNITPTTPVIDATLTISGAGADAKVTGDKITDLKNAINAINAGVNDIGELLANRYLTKAGNVQVYNGWSCTYNLPVYSDMLIIESSADNGGNYDAFYDSEGTFISNFRLLNGINVIPVPSNAESYRLSFPNGTEIKNYNWMHDKMNKGFINADYLWKQNNNGIIRLGDIGTEVDLNASPSSSHVYAYIDVKKGDIFKVGGSGGGNFRLWAFTDENNILLSKSASNLVADTPILISAPSDGKFIFGSYYANAQLFIRPNDGSEVAQITRNADAYAEKTDGLNILSAFNNVSCFGDSLTASVVYTGDNGDGTHRTRSAYKKYPWILGNMIGAEAESVATGGYSSTDWWNAYSDRIIAKDNQLIVVYLGTNGGLTETLETDAPGMDRESYTNTNTGNYCKIVSKALEVGARVLLVKVHQGGASDVFATNRVIDAVAEKFGVACVDVPYLSDRKYHAFPDNSGYNLLHYNDLGYAAFADSLIKCVGSLGTDMSVRLIPN